MAGCTIRLGRHSNGGKAELRDTLGRKLVHLYLCVLAISNRCSSDSSCAHKELVTNWPYYTILADTGQLGWEATVLSQCPACMHDKQIDIIMFVL